MKTTLTAIAVVIAAMAILVLAACASRTEMKARLIWGRLSSYNLAVGITAIRR
jgi:hypothetical protein